MYRPVGMMVPQVANYVLLTKSFTILVQLILMVMEMVSHPPIPMTKIGVCTYNVWPTTLIAQAPMAFGRICMVLMMKMQTS